MKSPIKITDANQKKGIKPQNSLIILLSFFGEFPWYFKFFLHSCMHNTTIVFCIISDNFPNSHIIPNNVYFVYKTMKQFEELATQKLGFPAKLSQGYKICDFRPTLAYLFPELIAGYDFWGYGDIDVIYGDLRYFLNNELLNAYDIFSFRPEYLTGSFTICRNTNKINSLFLQSRHYRTVLASSQYFNFDECNFIFGPLQEGIPIENIHCNIESMTHVVIRNAKKGKLRAYFDFNLLEGSIGNLKWGKGKIIYKNKIEAILYHFLKFKDNYRHNNRKIEIRIEDTIYVSRRNIYTKK